MTVKRTSSRAFAGSTHGQRFQPNRITAALLASIGVVPAWAADNTITVHNGSFGGGVTGMTTATTITATSATTTDITTATVRGNTGFNSFGDFKVAQGNTVNLHVPGSAQNLVNLVHNAKAEINGTLNGLKDGKIGGNVIFADPHGLVVGAQGVVNVGSLTVTTPSAAQMQNLATIANRGSVAETTAAVSDLTSGQYNGSSTGEVKVQGKVNTSGSINLFGASAIVASGASLQAGTSAAETVFVNTVNLQGVSVGTGLAQADGSVKIVGSNGVEVSGEVAALMADDSGGKVQIAAGNNVDLKSGARIVTTGSAGKNAGNVIIEAPHINVANNAQVNASASGAGRAGNITLQALSDISCTFCGDGNTTPADLDDLPAKPKAIFAGSAGSATIALDGGSTLDASHATDGTKAGTVTVQALATDQQLAGWASANASITANGLIKGRDIVIDAQSKTIIKPLWASSLLSLDNLTAFGELYDSLNQYNRDDFKSKLAADPGNFSELLALQDIIGLQVVSSDAKVSIGASADLKASNNLSVTAHSTRQIDSNINGKFEGINSLIPFGLGLTYGSMSGTTSVEVLSGAKLTVGKNLLLEASSDNMLDLDTKAVNSHDAGGNALTTMGIAFGMAHTDLDTHVTVTKGAVLDVTGDITARAVTEQDLSNTVSFEAIGLGASGGPAIALADYNSSTRTQFNADLTKGGNLNVSALDIIYQQVNSAEVQAGKSSSNFLYSKLTNPTINFITPKITDLLGIALDETKPTNGSKLRFGSAVTITQANHTAEALLGASGSGLLGIDVSGDVAVQALQYQASLRNTASSTVNANVKEKDGTKYSLSVALVYNELVQNTRALIGDNVTVKAKHIGVGAKNELPINDRAGVAFTGLDEWSSLGDVYSGLKGLATAIGNPGSLPSQYANATGESDKLGMAGAVSVMKNDINAAAWVGDNSTLSATGTGAWRSELWSDLDADGKVLKTWTLQTDNWSHTALANGANNWAAPVALLAENRLERLSVAGNFGIALFGSKSEKGSAVGAGLNIVLHDSSAVAGIGAGTQVTTSELSVAAKEKDLLINISPSAGKGPSVAGNGSLVLALVDSTVNASINNGATVKADRVDLDAKHALGLWSASGALGYSEDTGVGVGVAVNQIDSNIQALIGDNRQWRALGGAGVLGLKSTWNVDELDIQALSSGQSGAFSLAGAVARTDKEKQDAATANQDAAGGALSKATSLTESITLGLSNVAAELKAKWNQVKNLLDSDPTRTGNIPESSLAVAGSASVNVSRQRTQARVADVVLDPRDPTKKGSKVSVLALNQTHQLSGSGAGAITLAKNGNQSQTSSALSGAIAVNLLGNVTTAEVANATLNNNDLLKVYAATDGDLIAMGLGLAVATSGSQSNDSKAISASYAQFANTTQARVVNSTVTGRQAAPGILQVLAYDRTRSLIGGGAFAGAKGANGSAYGASVTLAALANTISAEWLGSTASKFASLDVGAYSASQVLVAALGVAGTSGEAGAASLFGAYLDNQVKARVDGYTPDGGSLVKSSLTGGSVNLQARSVSDLTDLDSKFDSNAAGTLAGADLGYEDSLASIDAKATTSDGSDANGDGQYDGTTTNLFDGKVSGEAVLGVAGSVAIGSKSAGGAAFGLIYAGSDYLASMANVTTDLSGALKVEAYNATETLAAAVGVAGSGKDASLGSGTAVIDRGTVTAQILGTAGAPLTVKAKTLDLSAQKAGGYYSLAGAIAFGGKGATGGAVAITDIEQAVLAQMAYVTATLDGTAGIIAAQESQIRSVSVAGAAGSGSAALTGSVSYNRIAGTTNALLNQSNFTGKALNIHSTQPGLSNSIWSAAGNIALADKGAAIGAAFAYNQLSGTRSAALTNSTVNLSGDLDIQTGLDGEIYGIAVGASGASTGGINISSVNNLIQGKDYAAIENSTVTQTGGADLNVQASTSNGLTIGSLAGAVTYGGTGSFGAASAVNVINADRTAQITGSSVSGFDQAQVRVAADQEINTLAVTAGGAGDLAVNGAVTTSVLKGTDRATIVGSTLGANGLDVLVEGDRTINALAVTVTGSGGLAVGAADANSLVSVTREARIGTSTLTLADTLNVKTNGSMAVRSAAVGAGGAANAAVGASVAVNLLSGKDLATLSGVTLSGADTVNVLVEDGTATVKTLAGNVQGAGTGAGAGAVAVTQITQERKALVENSSLSLDANAAFTRIKVSALTTGVIDTLALSGAGAGTGAAVFSNTTNSIDAVTTAAIDNSKGSASNLNISAKDDSSINSLAGGAVGAGSVAVGVATAINRIGNQIEAHLTGNRDASAWSLKQLLVQADSDARIRSASISAGVSGAVTVSAGVASNLLTTAVKSLISGGALVKADEDVGVLASSRDVVQSYAAVVAGGGNAAVSGLVTVNQLENTTTAAITGAATKVDARGNGSNGLSVDNGVLENAPDVGAWTDPKQFNPVADLRTGRETVHGLAVRASSLQQLGQLSAAAAISVEPIASAAVTLLSNTGLVSGSTQAYIEDAKINQDGGNANANAAQQVSVGASSHAFGLGGLVGIAAGVGAASVATNVDTAVFSRDVKARLSNVTLASKGETSVRANSTQAASSVLTTIGGGIVGVAATTSVLNLKGSTQALIEKAGSLNVGSLKVAASAVNRLSPNLYVGAGGVGAVGAGVAYASNLSTVRAWVGDAATGTGTGTTKVTTSGAIGIDAQSTTSVSSQSVSAAGGGVGAAGSINVVMLENTTEAGASRSELGSSGARAGSLSITAKDRLDAKLTGGSVAVGGSAYGATADVLVANSATRAQLNDSTAWLSGALKIDALREVDARLISVTGGLSGSSALGGSIGLLLLGSGTLTQQGSNPLDELDNNGNGTLSLVDKSATRSNTAQSYQKLDTSGERAVVSNTSSTDETARLDQATTSAKVKDRLKTNTAYKQETVARVSGSSVDANGAATISATDKLYSSNLAGSVMAGGGAFGAGVAYTLSNARVAAEILGGSLKAASLDLKAAAQGLDDKTAVNLQAIAGTAGLGVGLGAAVGVAVMNNLVSATLGGSVTTTGTLKGSASDSQGIDVQALGVAAAGGAAAGLVLGVAQHDSQVSLLVSPGATLTGSDITLGSASQGPVALKAQGAAGGLAVGLNASVLVARDASSATLDVGNGAKLLAGNAVNLSARATPQVKAESLGVALGGAVGAGATVIDAIADATARLSLAVNSQLQAKSATLAAQITRNGDNDTLNIKGVGVSGGIGLSANAVVATARNGSTALLESADSSLFTGLSNDGTWSFQAATDVRQRAGVEGYAAGLLTLGASVAKATSTTSTQALVGGRFAGASGTLKVGATAVVDNLARATAGQGGLISGAASVAITGDTGTTKARLYARGTDDSSNRNALFKAVELAALHQSVFNAFVDSVNASLVGASGAHAQNDLTLTTTSELAGGSRLETYAYEQSAKALVTKAQSSDYNVRSGSGGVVDAAAAQSVSSLSLNTNALVGASAYLHLIGDFRVPVNLLVSAYNQVTAYDKVRLDSGGAISIALAKSQVNVKQSKAGVAIGESADLSSIGDIVLSGSGDYLIDTAVTAKTWGLAGAAQGSTLAKVIADYDVDIAKNSTLLGYGDIRLYAGRSAAGKSSQATLTARTDLWNNTAFPVSTKPNADAAYVRTSDINVASGAQVNSVGDIYAYADKGYGNLLGKGVAKDLYTEALSALGLSVEIESGSATNTSTSVVKVDGALNSGYYNKRSVHIEGLEYWVNGVKKTLAEIAAMNIADSDTLVVKPKVTTSDSNITYRLVEGVYSQFITKRLAELDKQLADYGLSAVERTAMTAEQTVLRKALDKLYIEMGGSSAGGASLARDQSIWIFELDPILAKPGNVFVTGDALVGSGKLNAPGDAAITVTNDSSAFLRILGLEVPYREGGQLLFNDASLSTASAINSANATGYKGQANFSAITVSGNSPDPVITVLNNYDPSKGVTGQDGLRAPAPDIYIAGRIFNQRGLVTVKAEFGSIYANSDIRGKTLAISAGRDFVLNSADPFFHIGGDPATNNDGTKTTGPAAGSGVVAGNNVVISAQYLNINGLVQSGVPFWTATIDASTALDAIIAAGQAAYDAKKGPSFLQLKARNLRTGELGYGYDFATRSIVLDSVDVAGGYMELTGYIMSTGNGQLNVLDGYSQVQVKNTSNYQIGLNQIDLGSGTEGTLRINDVRRDGAGNEYVWSSIYTRDFNTATGLYNVMLRQGYSNNVLTQANVRIGDGRTATYTPVSGRSYVWLGGADRTATTTNVYYKDSFWGAFKVGEGNLYSTSTKTSAERPIDGAEYMGTSGGLAGGVIKKETEIKDTGDSNTESSSWTSCEKWFLWCQVKRSWMQTVTAKGQKVINRYTVAADNAINIGFIGYDSGLIDVNSKGNVVLLGSLFNQNGDTRINTSGSLTQGAAGAVVQAKNLTLDAGTGIGSSAQALRVQVGNLLSAKSLKGDINIAGINGGLNISRLEALAGNLSLKAQGNITTANGAVLRGHGISLTSTHGAIGAAGALVNIDTNTDNGAITSSAPSLNAQSVGGVFLNEVSGDLSVDQVITGGDVHLKVANGDLLDGNTSLSYDERDLAKLRALWTEMGLTGAEADAALAEQKAQMLKAGQASYARYWQLRDGQVFDLDQVAFSQAQVAQLKGLGLSDAQIATEQARAEADYLALHEQFGGAAYDANYQYALSTQDQNALDKTAKWSEEQLRYSLSSALVNRGTDTQVKIEKVNIQGANITLDAKRVGKVLANDVTVDLNQGVANLTPAQLAALGGAELDDIYVDDASNPNKLRIVQRDDINIVASGNINVTASSDVYLGGTQDLNIYNVQGDTVRIKTDGNIESARGSAVVVRGSDVVLESSGGSIGGKASLNIDVTGELTARAAKAINLTQAGNLSIQRLTTGNGPLTLNVGGNLSGVGLYGEHLLAGGDILLKVGGNVGDASHRVQLNSQTDEIDLDVGGDAYIGAMQGANPAKGTLRLRLADVDGLLSIAQVNNLVQSGDWTLGSALLDISHDWTMDAGKQVTASGTLDASIANLASLGALGAKDLDIEAGTLQGNANGVLWSADNVALASTLGDIGLSTRHAKVAGKDVQVDAKGKLFLDLAGGVTSGHLVSQGDLLLNTLGNVTLAKVQSEQGKAKLVGTGALDIGTLKARNAVDASGAGMSLALGELTSEQGDLLVDIGGAFSATTVNASHGLWSLKAASANIGSAAIDGNVDMTLGGDLLLGQLDAGGHWNLKAVKADVTRAGIDGATDLDLTGALTLGSLVGKGTFNLDGTRADIGSLTADGLVDMNLSGQLELDSLTGKAGWELKAGSADIGTAGITGNVVQTIAGALEMDALTASGSWTLNGGTTGLDSSLVKKADVIGIVDLDLKHALKLDELIAGNAVTLKGTSADIGSIDAQGQVGMTLSGNLDLDSLTGKSGWDMNAASADIGAVEVTGNAKQTVAGNLDMDSLKAGGSWVLVGGTSALGSSHVAKADITGLVDLDLKHALTLDELTGRSTLKLRGTDAILGTAKVTGTSDIGLSGDLKATSLTSGGNADLVLGSGSAIGTLDVTGDLDLKVKGALGLGLAKASGNAELTHTGLAGTALKYTELAIGGTLDVTGPGDWTGGKAVVNGDARFDVGSADLGSLDSTTGRLSLKAAKLFAADELHSRLKDVDLVSGSADLGNVSAATTLTALTNGNLTIFTGIAGGDISLKTVAGSLGTIRFGKLADPNDPTVLVPVHLGSDENITVETDGDVFGGNAVADKLVSLKGRNLFFGKVQSLGEDVFLQSTGLLADGNGDITGLLVEAKRDVSIIANGDLSMPTVKFGGTYSLKAGRDLVVGVGGDLDVSGYAEAGRDLTFLIAGKVDLKGVTAGRHISIESGKSINIDETVTGGGKIVLTARDGDLKVGGGILSTAVPYNGEVLAGDVVLSASGDIVTPLISVAAGNLDVEGHSLTLGDMTTSGVVDLVARGLIDVSGTSQSGGYQNWQAADSIKVGGGIVTTGLDLDGNLLTGNVILKAGNDITSPLIRVAAGDIEAEGHSLRLGAMAASGDIDLLARGLIRVSGTSQSGGYQHWHADDSIFFDRLLAQGQALLDSYTDTRGRVLSADQGAVVKAGWRNGVASDAGIYLDSATAPKLSLWSGNLVRVANAAIGQSADLHGVDMELYGRHTGSGQLNLWVEGAGDRYAKRFVSVLDAADILMPRLYAVDSTLTTTGQRVDIKDAEGVDLLKLYTAQAAVLMDNLTPAYQPLADVQLYELDKAFQLKQDGLVSNTSAYVVHRKTTHQVLVTNFSETHAENAADTGVLYQGISAARYSEQHLSNGLVQKRLESVIHNAVPVPPNAAPLPKFNTGGVNTVMNLDDEPQPQFSQHSEQDDKDEVTKWSL
ncbi:leukotoxin LktA family filamentous adhesin [Pseudomonas solani]|uniref:leukotoxin LktA family filamentous adhesin n=1 Tax=Pseudomonas solani TaxID=2731552 RepID=UPI003C2C4674